MDKEGMSIITNCPLCEEKSLHIIGKDEAQTQQCINCGYATAPRFNITDSSKENCKPYTTLTDEMKSWSQETDSHIWIPTILTLPFGLLFPENNKDGKLHWGFADLIHLSEDEQKKYPIPGTTDQFYKTKYDTDNALYFDTFLEAMVRVNNKAKESSPQKVDIKLPKLKKKDAK